MFFKSNIVNNYYKIPSFNNSLNIVIYIYIDTHTHIAVEGGGASRGGRKCPSLVGECDYREYR
jgi:hypothetical protein